MVVHLTVWEVGTLSEKGEEEEEEVGLPRSLVGYHFALQYASPLL